MLFINLTIEYEIFFQTTHIEWSFLISALLKSWTGKVFVVRGVGGGCHVLCRMVNNTPGLCPLDARTTSSPPKATTKHVSRHGQGSPPPRGSPAENPWGGAITSFFNNCVEFCSMNVLSFIYLFFRASQVALMVKNPPANAGDIRDTGSIPGSGRSPGGGNGNPLQLFLPGESPADRTA